jgi:hypothetical protein
MSHDPFHPSMKHPCCVRIKIGVVIHQDHRGLRWPDCLRPNEPHYFSPYMEFKGIWNEHGEFWDCVAPGFGDMINPKSYGNGSIYVYGYNNVRIVPPRVTYEMVKALQDAEKQLEEVRAKREEIRKRLGLQ